MPEIFRVNGFIAKFYANDHLPIHIHIRKGKGEIIFEIINNEVIFKQSYGLKHQEISQAEELAEQYKNKIINDWENFFKNIL